MVRNLVRKQVSSSTFAVLIALSSGTLNGASFQCFEQGASSLGYAHADMASLADDATTAWYNPAGMTRFCDTEIAIGVTNAHFDTFVDSFFVIDPSFSGIQLTEISALFGPLSILINVGSNPLSYSFNLPRSKGDTNQMYGYVHLIQPILHHYGPIDLAIGLSVATPWGWESNYSCTDLVSYAATTKIDSFAIAPSVAARVFNQISLGVQLKVERSSWHLSSQNTRLFGVNYSLHKWHCGWNFSFLYEPTSCFRVGATFDLNRSEIFTGTGLITQTNYNSRTNIDLPNSLKAGFTWDLRYDLSFTGTFVYTNWSKFKRLDIVSSNEDATIPNGVSTALDLQFKDTYLTSLGLRYIANDRFTFRGGLGFETPATRNKYREFKFHDSSHYFTAVGCNYAFNYCTSIDFGYMFTYLPSNGIQHVPMLDIDSRYTQNLFTFTPVDFPADAGVYHGTTKTLVHTFGLQFNCRF